MTTTPDARTLHLVPPETLSQVVDRLVAGVADLSARIDALEQAYAAERYR